MGNFGWFRLKKRLRNCLESEHTINIYTRSGVPAHRSEHEFTILHKLKKMNLPIKMTALHNDLACGRWLGMVSRKGKTNMCSKLASPKCIWATVDDSGVAMNKFRVCNLAYIVQS